MFGEKKINLICVGGVGETFFQFLEKERKNDQELQTLLLSRSDGSIEQKHLEADNFAKKIFCLLGASSTNNIVKIKSLYDLNPILWRKTHFILVHPFRFEGEDKAKKASDFSEFVTFQGSEKTDLNNQDLLKQPQLKNSQFEEGYEFMNQWILSIIQQQANF